jgi:hypothetical protein
MITVLKDLPDINGVANLNLKRIRTLLQILLVIRRKNTALDRESVSKQMVPLTVIRCRCLLNLYSNWNLYPYQSQFFLKFVEKIKIVTVLVNVTV